MNVIRYSYKNSIFHKLDPRSKIVFFFVLFFLAYFPNDLLFVSILYLVIIVCSLFSRVDPLHFFKENIVWGILIFFFSFLIVIWGFNDWHLSLKSSILITIRWLVIIQGSILFAFTTNPQDLIVALAKIKVPKSVAFSIGIGFRMMPEIIDKAQAILIAQRSRGWDSRTRLVNLFRLPAILSPLVIPLLAYVVESVKTIDTVLDVRGFNLNNLTSNPFIFLSNMDYLIIVLSVIIFTAFLFILI